MPKSKYSQFSPYAKVKQTWYLDYNLPAPMIPADTDIAYVIPTKYDEQPWRLAKELYGNERVYNIFALLNPDLLKDPIYDFKSGLTIQIPTPTRVETYLNSSMKTK